MKNSRTLKVYRSTGAKQDSPKIVLQGDWLKAAGYNIGDLIDISFSDNLHIIIKPHQAN